MLIKVKVNTKFKIGGLIMPKSETEYELEAKEYISHLEPQVQKLAVKAIDDALAMQRS